jgi:hypothetical protein
MRIVRIKEDRFVPLTRRSEQWTLPDQMRRTARPT